MPLSRDALNISSFLFQDDEAVVDKSKIHNTRTKHMMETCVCVFRGYATKISINSRDVDKACSSYAFAPIRLALGGAQDSQDLRFLGVIPRISGSSGSIDLWLLDFVLLCFALPCFALPLTVSLCFVLLCLAKLI